MVDIMQTSTSALLHSRVKACITSLNDYSITAGALIPIDWYNGVDIDLLDLEHPDFCPFGQLFSDVELPKQAIEKFALIHGHRPCTYNGYSKGLVIFAPASANGSCEWAVNHGLTIDSFIQDETYTSERQWADLNSVWIDELGKAKLFASTAEGMAIMQEGN